MYNPPQRTASQSTTKYTFEWRKDIVAGLGLEPRFHAPEACVLPLDDPAKSITYYSTAHY